MRKLKKINSKIQDKFKLLEEKVYDAMDKSVTSFNEDPEKSGKELRTIVGTIIRYMLAGRHKMIEKELPDDPLDDLEIKGLDSEQL